MPHRAGLRYACDRQVRRQLDGTWREFGSQARQTATAAADLSRKRSVPRLRAVDRPLPTNYRQSSGADPTANPARHCQQTENWLHTMRISPSASLLPECSPLCHRLLNGPSPLGRCRATLPLITWDLPLQTPCAPSSSSQRPIQVACRRRRLAIAPLQPGRFRTCDLCLEQVR